MYSKILNLFGLDDNIILNCYPYGSQVYGTADYQSDYDFILVCQDGTVTDEFSLDKDNINIHQYNKNSFQELVNKHKISSLECVFLNKNQLLKHSIDISFKLNKSVLRKSISEKASHSWVKSKKKFEVEKDRNIYLAKKSLFHSFRIIDFGIQIAKHGKIQDFGSMNAIWFEIKDNTSESWEHYNELYKEKYNRLMSEFRELAPK